MVLCLSTGYVDNNKSSVVYGKWDSKPKDHDAALRHNTSLNSLEAEDELKQKTTKGAKSSLYFYSSIPL